MVPLSKAVADKVTRLLFCIVLGAGDKLHFESKNNTHYNFFMIKVQGKFLYFAGKSVDYYYSSCQEKNLNYK